MFVFNLCRAELDFCISVKIQESTVQGLIPFLPMQICCCGWEGKGAGLRSAPFTCFRRSMVYIALCWYSSILFSKNVCLFLFLYKYYINIYTHMHIFKKNKNYTERVVYAFVMTKKKNSCWKQINVLSDITWLCAGVLVRWCRRPGGFDSTHPP